ncbi:MAG: hypothetical protein AB1742_08305 [bacterium]
MNSDKRMETSLFLSLMAPRRLGFYFHRRTGEFSFINQLKEHYRKVSSLSNCLLTGWKPVPQLQEDPFQVGRQIDERSGVGEIVPQLQENPLLSGTGILPVGKSSLYFLLFLSLPKNQLVAG